MTGRLWQRVNRRTRPVLYPLPPSRAPHSTLAPPTRWSKEQSQCNSSENSHRRRCSQTPLIEDNSRRLPAAPLLCRVQPSTCTGHVERRRANSALASSQTPITKPYTTVLRLHHCVVKSGKFFRRFSSYCSFSGNIEETILARVRGEGKRKTFQLCTPR